MSTPTPPSSSEVPSTPDGQVFRILVVEDERHLATGLKLNFEFEGYQVDLASTGREALTRLARPDPYAAIILDVTLPDTDGFSLCKRLREAGNFTPVIMLTARTLAEDRVTGLESGADDYLTKPFDLDELLARVRSMLRRQQWEKGPAGRTQTRQLTFGRARVDFDTHEVTVAGQTLHLTQLELALLHHLADNAGQVVSRADLLEKVWKLRNYPNTRTVDNFVLRLRRHFEPEPARPVYFLSVRGAGYKFDPGGQ